VATLAADLVTLSRIGVQAASLYSGSFLYDGARPHHTAVLHNGAARYSGEQHHTMPPKVGVQLQTAIKLAASLSAESATTAPLFARAQFAATPATAGSVSADLSTAINMAAGHPSSGELSANLTTAIRMAGDPSRPTCRRSPTPQRCWTRALRQPSVWWRRPARPPA
jgi:hypothetical protein